MDAFAPGDALFRAPASLIRSTPSTLAARFVARVKAVNTRRPHAGAARLRPRFLTLVRGLVFRFAMEFGGAGGARRGVWRHGCGGVAGDRAGVAAEVITPESLEVIPPESQEPEEVVTPDLEMEVVPDSQMEAVPDSITLGVQVVDASVGLQASKRLK